MDASELFGRVGSASSAFGTVLEVMGAFGDSSMAGLSGVNKVLGGVATFARDRDGGHGIAESAVDAGLRQVSGTAAGYLGVRTPLGTAINFANSVAGAFLPREVSDVTGLAADVTPEKFLQNLMRQGGRAVTNLVTGDDEALDRQYDEILDGDAGVPLQGYAGAYDAYRRMEDGEDPHDALYEAGAGMEDSIVEEAYEALLGEEDDGTHFEEEPEDGVYEATSGNAVIDWVCRDLIGL